MEDRLLQMQQNFLKKKQRLEDLKAGSNDLNTVINFKVNSEVKAEFDRICKASHSTISRELKLYILQVISQGRL